MNVTLIEGTNLRERARALGGQSRSYCEPYALVAFHDGPVGVDIERVVPCDARFAASIVMPGEDVPRTDADIISLWSAKEALAKALGDAVRYDPRRLPALREGVTGAWHAQALDLPDGFKGWVCWR